MATLIITLKRRAPKRRIEGSPPPGVGAVGAAEHKWSAQPDRTALLLALFGLATAAGCQRDGGPGAGWAVTPAETAAAASAGSGAAPPGATGVRGAGRPRSGGVGALLEQPPPAMTSVTLEAYSGEGYQGWPGRGRFESMSGCPSVDSAPLVDQPLWQTVGFGGHLSNNPPPADAPWLIAAGMDLAKLPRFGRLRGHLGDPRFAHCDDAERIFVVEAVETVYEPRGPDHWPTPDPATWTTLVLPSGGARLRHPADWTLVPAGADRWRLTSPDWPDTPLQLQVLAADPGPARASAAARGLGDATVFRQRESAWTRAAKVLPLEGTMAGCQGKAQAGCVEVRMAQGGKTYVFRQEYGHGFSFDPRVLAHAQWVLDSFEILGRATFTPIPAPKTELGPGPFWSQAQAERMALDMIEGAIVLPKGGWQVSDAQLVSEAEALSRGGCDLRRDADNPWYSYPDGVWLLELTAQTKDRTLVYATYLDAGDGGHLCTAERR